MALLESVRKAMDSKEAIVRLLNTFFVAKIHVAKLAKQFPNFVGLFFSCIEADFAIKHVFFL